MSTVSVNIESGHTLYTDIVDEPFFQKNVIVKSTDKPADNPADKQTELVTANMSLSQDISLLVSLEVIGQHFLVITAIQRKRARSLLET